MSKAILVMDMPIGCEYCPCNYEWECKVFNRPLESLNRPNWCPLIPAPKHVVTTEETERDRGWNACVDYLTGGGENG